MARQVGRFRAWVECAAVAPLWAPLRSLPLERAVRLGAAIGTLGAALDRVNHGVAARNLAIAFPEAKPRERRKLLRATYRNFGRMAAEWLHFRELNRGNIERYVTYEGLENWDNATRISDGRGILILTGHFGNFELLSQAHSIYGTPTAIVYRPLRNPILDRAVADLRQRCGNATVPRKGAGREIVRFLKDNWLVAVPLDLDVRHGVFVDYFSVKAATSPALARVAMATGAPVLPAFIVREAGSTRHRITFLPVIEVIKTRDRVESVRENTQRFTTAIETMVRRHPDHWNWIHRRWKTRPPGEARFY